MENCGRFVFYNDIFFTKNQKQNNLGLYSHISTNQRARIRSVIVKQNIEHFRCRFKREQTLIDVDK